MNIEIKRIKYCKCGCKKVLKNQNKNFISGHNLRILSDTSKNKIANSRKGKSSWNKGIATPEKVKKKISKSLKGKSKTEEHNNKVSIALKNYHNNMSVDEKEKRRIKYSGRIVSVETRKLMSMRNKERYAKKEEREKISKSVKKLWKDFGYRKKQMDSQLLKKDKQSKSAIKRIKKNPRTAGGYGKQGYFYSKKNNKKLHYRSSYELIAYQILEQMTVVKSYETEPFAILYYFEGFKHRTIPDILVTYKTGLKEFIEVKALWRIEDNVEIAKFSAVENYAKENNMNFSIWTEKELGILN